MRTLLTMCTLVAAILGPVGARASGAPPGRVGTIEGEVETGFLDVGSNRPARVLIDGTDTKTVTPQPHLELKAGHHQLTLITLDGSRQSTLGFNVEPGQTTKLTIVLSH